MPNIALDSQIKAEINNVPIISITRVQPQRQRPGTVKVGGYGTIGAAKGIATGSGTITFAVLAGTPEIDINALYANDFVLTWNAGPNRNMCTAILTGDTYNNNPGTGDYEISLPFIFGDLVTL